MGALPKQVQKQVDEANSILDEINKPPELDAEGNPIEPPAEPAPTEPKVVQTVVLAPEDEPAPPPEPPPEPPSAPEDKGMEHKYKVLQGKYNAEVPRLQRELKTEQERSADMQQRMTNTESLLATMQHLNTEPAATTPPSPATLPTVSADETAQFGPDLEDYIERVAARKIMPEVDSRLAPVSNRLEGVEQSASQQASNVARSERDKVLLALETAVPEWETQNEDEGFLQWLNENDPYAGVARGQLLTQAFRSNDSTRVIAFFKGFQTENAVVTPELPVTPPATTTEPQRKLDDLVAPGTPKTGTTSAPNESGKRVWTQQDISSFYAEKNRIIQSGKKVPEKFDTIERDIFAAQSEGRIR